MEKVKTGVIGCGSISEIYLTNMIHKFSTLEVTACSASHMESALKRARQFGIKAVTTEELLQDPEIELVVVLTPTPTHYELVKSALLAGKHAYTEKTISESISQAEELLSIASEKGLLLGSAPETFMGSALQTARKAINDGILGEITSFHVTANRDLTILASLFKFLRMPGGGIGYDYGVYYLTALVSLLGPMKQVFAQVGNHKRIRKNSVPFSPEYGQDYIYDNEAQVNAVLTTESGITGTFSLNGDSALQDQAYFTIHGTGGILQLGDANSFGGEIRFLPDDLQKSQWLTIQPVSTLSDNCRGIGPADMARCIREGGKHLTEGHMGYHVLDIIEQIMQSGRTGQICTINSSMKKPPAFDNWRELLQ